MKRGTSQPRARRQGNGYRDYTAGDIRTLKLIRMLRMLDVPLPLIKAVLAGDAPCRGLQAQQTVLEQRQSSWKGGHAVCADLARQDPSAAERWMWTPA